RVLLLAHLEEGHPVGQFERLRAEIQTLRESGVKGLQVYANVDDDAQLPQALARGAAKAEHSAFYGSVPKSAEAMARELGEEVQVVGLEAARMDSKGNPLRRDVYVTSEGVAVHYPDRPESDGKRMILWK